MKIAKILNNNVVITLDDRQEETVVMGKRNRLLKRSPATRWTKA